MKQLVAYLHSFEGSAAANAHTDFERLTQVSQTNKNEQMFRSYFKISCVFNVLLDFIICYKWWKSQKSIFGWFLEDQIIEEYGYRRPWGRSETEYYAFALGTSFGCSSSLSCVDIFTRIKVDRLTLNISKLYNQRVQNIND